ncbi:class I SAM-dependent methyltransferase [Streptomyces montanus]|uniref:Class I SAM-dependent methyltransferase n=1 Tax=Streptomyces montanus TaxID=2580423 RepID=A0A5R9FPH9_9ACTN|nr:class I SAM-dependent methyltransferase [Streptomyces montanus]TLS42723.1 class I SAM-dependent methyltransferase [Streptomyces montanus]
MLVNSHQAAAWSGYEGRYWADHQDRYDGINDGANTPLLDAAALAPSARVLDIGCGNGRVTRLAAGRAAYALGIDLSAPVLERARASAAAAWGGDGLLRSGEGAGAEPELVELVDYLGADGQDEGLAAGRWRRR